MKTVSIRYIVDDSTYTMQFKTDDNCDSFNINQLKKIIAKDILDNKLNISIDNKHIHLKSNIINILVKEIKIINLTILPFNDN